MKDVISILQSRIAKRSNEICEFSSGAYEGKLILANGGAYFNSSLLCDLLAEQQKQDKRILAEIIRLRRVQKDLVKANISLSHKLWNKHLGKSE